MHIRFIRKIVVALIVKSLISDANARVIQIY